MRLNIQKTEIVVFGTNKNNDKFLFKGIELKKSTTFKYLGFVLNNKGNWKDHVKEMVGRGKAVSSAVLRNSALNEIKNIKMHKYLFQSKIRPTIHYGAELWGYEVIPQLEMVQLQYYKRLVRVHATTHTQALKGDLGLFSLHKERLLQVVKFWLKIIQLPDERLMKAAYFELLQQGRKRSWPFHVKALLDKAGLSYAWNEGLGPTGDPEEIYRKLKHVKEDQEIQLWHEQIRKSETLRQYSKIKESFGLEYYFKLNLPPENLRLWFQVRANGLPLKSRLKVFERNAQGPRSCYTCSLCGMEEENLLHFLTVCQGLSDLRLKYLGDGEVFFPGILKSSSRETIIAVTGFIKEGLKRCK